MDGQKRTLSVKGEYKDPGRIGNIIVRGYVRRSSIPERYCQRSRWFLRTGKLCARLDGKNVITLNVIKQSGKNLIDASDKIQCDHQRT